MDNITHTGALFAKYISAANSAKTKTISSHFLLVVCTLPSCGHDVWVPGCDIR